MLKHVNKDEFNELLKQDKILVVDFFAEWCGPCQMLGPVLESLANEIDNIQSILFIHSTTSES